MESKPGYFNIRIHKGLSTDAPDGPTLGFPTDIPQAARDWPMLNFIIYRSCVWPGFWMLPPTGWPTTGEIDIMEDVNGLSKTSGALHCGNLTQRNPDGTTGPCHEKSGLGSGLKDCTGCLQTFHTYSVIIDRRDAGHEEIRWYLDGRQFYSVNESRIV